MTLNILACGLKFHSLPPPPPETIIFYSIDLLILWPIFIFLCTTSKYGIGHVYTRSRNRLLDSCMPIQIGATENSRPHAAMGPYRTLSQFLLLLLCLPSLNTASNGSSYNFLVFHAPTPMSHAKVLHVVTRELVARGHSVTTVRFEMEQPLGFKDLGKNHTEIVLYLNNSDGALKSVTKVL